MSVAGFIPEMTAIANWLLTAFAARARQ